MVVKGNSNKFLVFLATETVGLFTGVYVGLYATGNGKPWVANVNYDWFEYVVDEK